MKNIKRFLWFCLMVMFVILLFVFLFFALDSEGACLDNKGVWDRKNKVCRYDCLKWTDKEGCVPL
jgi:hypothetical protein